MVGDRLNNITEIDRLDELKCYRNYKPRCLKHAEIDCNVKTVSQLRGWIFIAAAPAEIIGDLVTCVKQIAIAAFDLTTLDALIISQSRN